MISDPVLLAIVALGAGAIAATPPTILAFAQLRASKNIKNKVDGNFSALKAELMDAKSQIKVLTERLITSTPSTTAQQSIPQQASFDKLKEVSNISGTIDGKITEITKK